MKRSLFGYALTTKAIAKEGGWDIYDDKFSAKCVDEFGNNLLPVCEFKPDISELEIPSPGFLPTHNLIMSARNLISEYDYFKDTAPLKIWISGTNGKTTTTKMTQHLLEKFGSQMGGNVGTPLALLDKNAKIWVLETSSFTLHYTKFAYPNIYALLPITPDHLSWHGDFDNYVAAKLKPLLSMKEGSVAIIPFEFKDKIKTMAHVVYYKNEEDLSRICGAKVEEIAFKTPFLMDALFGLCIEKIIFDSADTSHLNEFCIEPNKLEEFVDVKGRMWVNDTKATNLDAALQALKRYENQEIHLIIGGDDKGVDLSDIFKFAQNINVTFYAIGSNTYKLLTLADKFGIKAVRCEELYKAVNLIDMVHKTTSVALLSPACASLDQFSSYAERGDKFKEFVKDIGKNS